MNLQGWNHGKHREKHRLASMLERRNGRSENARETETLAACAFSAVAKMPQGLLSHYQFDLVGGFNAFEKYARQIGSSPQGSG